MIPADAVKSLQVTADSALRPVAPEQDFADKLSGLAAGDKVMAQIQAVLPNGTYRALINQRVITLALPFSAKSGDTLELQVTENDGQLALAVLNGEGEGGEGTAGASVRATLSPTGQLIGTLLNRARDSDGQAAALPLNDNQPIGDTPVSAQDLLPQLKQAITQSGMFYEAHQAEWVEGRLTKSALLQEPQGKLSTPQAFLDAAQETTAAEGAANASAATRTADTAAATASVDDTPGTQRSSGTTASSAEGTRASAAQTSGQLVAPQAQALVRQQLEALATQNFSWQGQIWPGQQMRWEIDEYPDENAGRGARDEESTAPWSTRLHLTLPTLGEIDARLRLQGNQVTLSLSASNTQTRDLMRASGVELRRALEDDGITVTAMGVAALSAENDDGPQAS